MMQLKHFISGFKLIWTHGHGCGYEVYSQLLYPPLQCVCVCVCVCVLHMVLSVYILMIVVDWMTVTDHHLLVGLM